MAPDTRSRTPSLRFSQPVGIALGTALGLAEGLAVGDELGATYAGTFSRFPSSLVTSLSEVEVVGIPEGEELG